MADDLANIDPDLRAKLEALVHRDPGAQEKVDELLATRAAGDARKRIEIDNILERLVAPRNWTPLALAVGLVLAVVLVLIYTVRSQQQHAAAVARGIPTLAKILRTTPGDCSATPKRTVCLRLDLELHPTGAPVYTGSLSEAITSPGPRASSPACGSPSPSTPTNPPSSCSTSAPWPSRPRAHRRARDRPPVTAAQYGRVARGGSFGDEVRVGGEEDAAEGGGFVVAEFDAVGAGGPHGGPRVL